MSTLHTKTPQASDKPIFISGLSKEMEKVLLSRGVPGQDLIPRKTKIEVSEALVKIEQDFPYKQMPQKIISAVKQYRVLQSVMENPIRSSYVLGISSFPSDARAKYLAQTIMAAGCAMWAKHRRPGRGLPLWHRVYGSFGDPLRDSKVSGEMPSMLIISNVCMDSSAVKIEKVRDLLEKYSEIPRIVITGGTPSHNLFASKLFYPMRQGFYIGPSNMVQDI